MPFAIQPVFQAPVFQGFSRELPQTKPAFSGGCGISSQAPATPAENLAAVPASHFLPLRFGNNLPTQAAPDVESVLKQLEENTSAITDVSIMCLPDQVSFSGKLSSGRPFSLVLHKPSEEGAEPKAEIILNPENDADKTTTAVDAERLMGLVEKLDIAASGPIGEMYGTGPNLDVTQPLMEVASQVLEGKIQFEPLKGSGWFTGGATATLENGTQVILIAKTGLLVATQYYVGFEKPNCPPQILPVNSQSERDAMELLNSVHDLMGKEETLRTAQAELQTIRQELTQQLSAARQSVEAVVDVTPSGKE